MKKLTTFQQLLGVFILFIFSMIICRMWYSGSFRFIFLMWNLFLAWIPFQLSLFMSFKRGSNKWLSGFLLIGWLLFFPNALYIITDLIHLDGKTNVPIWYDAILLFASSIAGLIMAFASLYNVEIFLLSKMRHSVVNRLIIACLFLGSFGVYLGRFLRWNSWDVITDPFNLITQIIAPFIRPSQHYRTWCVTALLTCLFSLLYFTIKKLPGFFKEPGKTIIV